jgi:antirestriction protein ArdC
MDASKSSQLHGVVERFAAQLAAETEAAKSSVPLLQYLKAAAQFHDYSLHNTILIFSQMPTATRVAGYRAWHKLGRFVRKGEHGIVILAPVLPRRREADAEEEETTETAIRFRTAHVFDISQTEGMALPEAPVLTGTDCGTDLALALVSFADERSITVRYEELSGSACGVSRGGEVVIDSTLSDGDAFAVLVHEIGHELLNHRARRDDLDKRTREIEAETCSFVVCEHFGIPTTAPSYLALHQASAADVTARLAGLVGTIQDIIRGVENHLSDIQQSAPAVNQ